MVLLQTATLIDRTFKIDKAFIVAAFKLPTRGSTISQRADNLSVTYQTFDGTGSKNGFLPTDCKDENMKNYRFSSSNLVDDWQVWGCEQITC